ncbi:hypothetical protein ACFYVL_17355 [Streptomyces sp. NPDC004111]|uniref:hypothetical protein n=1 Tax=Streptomyces sp. NPDC004111 TaxID=3364690 RepID=UPI0036A3EB7D
MGSMPLHRAENDGPPWPVAVFAALVCGYAVGVHHEELTSATQGVVEFVAPIAADQVVAALLAPVVAGAVAWMRRRR